MTDAIVINARFLTQSTTGVQRFAREITLALSRLQPAPILLGPREARLPDGWNAGPWRLDVSACAGGHIWEQLVLPRQRGGAVLVNLANSAPLFCRRQLLVIHDAGVFATPEAYSWRFRCWYRLLHRVLARRGVALATVSEFSRREIARHVRVPQERVAVIGEGAEHILREPMVPPPLPVGGYVLAVGTPAAHKNLAVLEATAAMLHGRGLELVATGGVAGGVFSAASWPAGIRPLGRVDDAALAGLYRGAACLVFPSRYEGFGLPAIEAMACGCPVVASSIPGLRETCGEAALFADPADPRAFVAAVARLLDAPAEAARLRAAGLARARALTWPAAAQRLLGALAGIG
ncbi:MAG: glycosyltransferase family 4 protein [Rhodospirillales bacterium]|nr:glycosyltransferase family 4 protein [Rhodospirillales bacterium]